MYIEPSQAIQLSAAIVAAILIFIAAYAAPLKLSVGALLLLIPFQLVETSYGSSNVVMTYVLAVALMLRARLRHAPMLGCILGVLFAFMITVSQIDGSLYFVHTLQVVLVLSGFLVFLLAYNLTREVEDPRFTINILIACNVLAIGYCFVQLGVGPGENLVFFSIGDVQFAMQRNRGAGDPRLVGPFGTPGITAAYFMTMTVVLVYEIFHSRHGRRLGLIALAILNVAMLIGTANRGSFLVLAASMLGFVYLFRAELGFARVVQILVVSGIVLTGIGTIFATYTDFGQFFERLETTTHFEGGLPDTRQRVWPEAWAVVPERPWLGHGPRLVTPGELRRREDVHPAQLVLDYPHSLYLYLLVTVGVLGTTWMLLFLFGALWRVHRASRYGTFVSDYERGLVVLGVLVLGGILVDQLKIEMLRRSTIDYAHFVFAMFGIFLGWADRARLRSQAAPASAAGRQTQPLVPPSLQPVPARHAAHYSRGSVQTAKPAGH